MNTAKESRLNYTAHGIKGKNGEIISGCGYNLNYLATWYKFDATRLELRLDIKEHVPLLMTPRGCEVRNDSEPLTDYFENDRLIIPATAGAEFLAAAIGYQKAVEMWRKKGEKIDYYRQEAERADRQNDALNYAKRIASGEITNGAAIIAKRIQAAKEEERKKQAESNKSLATKWLKETNPQGHTVEKHGDIVIYRQRNEYCIFDGRVNFGQTETHEAIIAINIKTGAREQINTTLAEAREFYQKIIAQEAKK